MGNAVSPKVRLIGLPTIDMVGMRAFLRDVDALEFLDDIFVAQNEHNLSDAEILTSFYAKLCYLSLVEGHNDNLSRKRSIYNNLIGTINQAHGSVFEHAMINFAVSGVSRVFECELIRHRVGTAFSIESGRFVRKQEFDMVIDPCLNPVLPEIVELWAQIEKTWQVMQKKLGVNDMTDMDQKKRLTSALRRILPEGKAKQIGFSLNLRTIRHTVQMRTSRHAEWEIRTVFAQVYQILKERFPLLFYGAKEEYVRNILEVSGMRLQPYEEVRNA